MTLHLLEFTGFPSAPSFRFRHQAGSVIGGGIDEKSGLLVRLSSIPALIKCYFVVFGYLASFYFYTFRHRYTEFFLSTSFLVCLLPRWLCHDPCSKGVMASVLGFMCLVLCIFFSYYYLRIHKQQEKYTCKKARVYNIFPR